jgi:DNA-binding LytR/AlgR family response regulator
MNHINIVIVEDELPAAEQMRRFVEAYKQPVTITGMYTTCAEMIKQLDGNEIADVIFCDIELRDGNALQALQQIDLKAVIIFTTAYDGFWSESLRHNGIDYLLKPMTQEKVHAALDKVATLKKLFTRDNALLSQLAGMLQQNKSAAAYKKRFPVKLNNEVFIVDVEEIQFFRISSGVIFAHISEKKKYPIPEETLDALGEQLDPAVFFRVNRSDIVNINFIKSIRIQDGNDYSILLKDGGKLVVSNSRLKQLKDWLK